MKLEILENSKNYTCSVVEIRDVFDIEGADNIKRTIVNGNTVVIPKSVNIGDKMLYFVSGTKLSHDYCHKNNLYDKSEENYDNTKKGFISFKNKRVKAIKLRGIISDGMLMSLDSLLPFIEKGNIFSLKVGDEFNTINGNILCEKYIVVEKNSGLSNKSQKTKTPKISRLVDNQFHFHNDTSNLRKNIHKIDPNDTISIHYKKHGTSFVAGNILVKKNLKWYEKFLQKLGVNIVDTEYDVVYSSRKVVKNQHLNSNTEHFYQDDIWGLVTKDIKHLIPKNWTLYGEIVGYTPWGSPIQGKYDYGCKPGEYKTYIYKISIVNPDGKVIYLTDKQIQEWCDKVGLLYSDTFIYYGTIDSLFESMEFNDWDALHREVERDTWQETLLDYLEYKYNEKDCYMCINKVPEEGIILRVEKFEEYEAYKLKSKRFTLMESDEQENGVSNIEDNN
jgi:tRNA-binding EMAP/Myf-like protein